MHNINYQLSFVVRCYMNHQEHNQEGVTIYNQPERSSFEIIPDKAHLMEIDASRGHKNLSTENKYMEREGEKHFLMML